MLFRRRLMPARRLPSRRPCHMPAAVAAPVAPGERGGKAPAAGRPLPFVAENAAPHLTLSNDTVILPP